MCVAMHIHTNAKRPTHFLSWKNSLMTHKKCFQTSRFPESLPHNANNEDATVRTISSKTINPDRKSCPAVPSNSPLLLVGNGRNPIRRASNEVSYLSHSTGGSFIHSLNQHNWFHPRGRVQEIYSNCWNFPQELTLTKVIFPPIAGLCLV